MSHAPTEIAEGGTPVAGSCVLLGATAILLRGPSGSGKSTLARTLIDDPAPFSFARLVADDRTFVRAAAGRLLASPPAPIAGRLEIRGLGLARLDHEPLARLALVADLVEAARVTRLPERHELSGEIFGIALPRLPVAAHDPFAPALLRRAMAWIAAGHALDEMTF